MIRSTPARHLRARMTAIAVAAAVILTGLTLLAAPAAETASATVPGQPGTAQAGTPVYTDAFSNQNASTTPINILSYQGSAGTGGADGETYTADLGYTPAGGQCDGWVMSSTSTQPTALQDAGCANNAPTGWQQLQTMANDLGLFQGQTATQAAANQDLTEYTNSPLGTIAAGYELKTLANNIPAVAGHYYAVSADFAEVNCFAAQASETFYLVENGTPTVVGSGLDPCTAAGAANYGGVDGVYISKLQSAALQLPATGTPSLGLQLYNAQATGSGNDVAFDLPQIVDVTPQLDKSFSPTTIGQGQTSTLTYTITNTSDLDAKNGWGLTDNLPSGLTATGVNSTTCSTGMIAAASGATTVTVTGGDLNKGQASCTVSVQVTASVVGSYTNGPGNFPTSGGLTGLNPPGSATLTVIPTVNLSIVKTANAATYNSGDPIIYTIKVTNAGPSAATGATITDPLPAQVTGATWSCSASSGSACGAASGSGSISTTATIASAGTITYTVTGTVVAGTAAGTTISNTATVVPPSGTSDVNCPPSPGVGCSSTVTATTNQSVQVNKTWTIKNAAGTVIGTFNIPTQGTDTATSLPAGFSAAPTLTGKTSPSFGTAYTGYSVGQSVSVGEGTVTIPSGCTVASQKMTSVNGAILTTAASLPYAGTVTATPSPNTFTITNTITCTQTLTLVKKVAYGSLPAADWTLKGTGPSGSLSGPSGATGSAGATTVSVTPQVSYALAESSAAAGSQNYVPTAAGWVCVAGSTSVPVSSASVVVGYGQAVTCTITNTTAEITVLKHIQGTGGLTSGQFNLTITPPSGLGSASTFAGSETAVTANTFEVQPGAAYTVAEQALSSSTAYLSLGLQQSTDGGNTWTTVSGTQASAPAGTQVFYRFVNESVPVIALPLTGGLGTDVIAYWALALLGAAAALIAVQLYRRRKASRR
jgi:uncharacterized repeat protein (TIGR01451 family)